MGSTNIMKPTFSGIGTVSAVVAMTIPMFKLCHVTLDLDSCKMQSCVTGKGFGSRCIIINPTSNYTLLNQY